MEPEKHAERWVRQIIEEHVQNQRRRAAEWLKHFTRRREKGFTKGDIAVIMRILCYKNLAMCCGVEKRCGYRDSVLEILGLSREDYSEYKKRCGSLLLRLLRKKGVI